MKLLEHIYGILRQAGLTTSREAFSRDYVCKSRNWFAYQRHMGRELGAAAAIQCLRSIRLQRQRGAALNDGQQRALEQVERELLEHLNAHHFVADVVC